MSRPASLLFALAFAGCYDKPDAIDGDTDGDDAGASTSVSATDSNGSSDGPSTSASTTMTATTTPTTGVEATTDPDESGSGGADESSSTGDDHACEDGLFVGDAPPFGAAGLVTTLLNTQGVEIIDVDDDGNADLLLGDFGDGGAGAGVHFLRGHGDGSFDAATQLPGGDIPVVRIAAAPISDATVDVVAMVLIPPSNDIGVRRWRGNGDGTFLAPADYPGASDWDVTLFDVDGDGRRDLLGTGGVGARVALADVSESFGAVTEQGGVMSVNTIKGADLDGDGNGDIVSAASDELWVLLGTGDGSFAPVAEYALSGSPSDVFAGDFDNDGAVDVGATFDAVVAVLPGDGAGGLGAATELTVQGSTLGAAAIDFDDDGCSDVAVINTSGSVSTILGRQSFTFTPQQVFNLGTDGYAYDIAAGDVDNDGIADVVAVTAGGSADMGGEVYLLRSAG